MPVTPDQTTPEPVRLGLRAYARHRGCALSSVQQAIKEGRITRGTDGKIDPVEADREWAENTRQPVTATNDRSSGQNTGHEHMTFAQAREMKEQYLAAKHKLDFDIKRGALIDRQEVDRQQFAIARKVRDAILAIPDRIAEQLAAETDPRKAYEILQSELRIALHALADALEADDAAA